MVFSYKKSQFNLIFYKAGLESVEARLAHYKKNEGVFEESINVLKLEVRLRANVLDEYKMKLDKAEKEKDRLKQTLENFQNSSKSLNDLLESQVIDKFKTGLGYNAGTAASPTVKSFVNLSDKSRSDKGYHSVPPPLTGNFIPRKPDLTFIDEIVESENMDVTTVVSPRESVVPPINEELVSDGKKKTVFPTVSKIEFVGPKQLKKPVRKPVKYAEMYMSQRPKGNQRNWNNQKSQQLGSDFVMLRAAVNAAKPKAVHNVVKRNRFHDVKASACWVWKPKNKVIDHIQGRHEHEPEFDFDAANVPITTTGAEISTDNPKVKTTGDSIEDIAAETLVYIRRSAAKAKDKAVRLQGELDKEERQRIPRAEGLKTAGYRFTTAGSRLLLLEVLPADSEVDSCSKSCVKAYATLKEQYDSLSSDYKKSQFNLVSYKAGYSTATAVSPAVESFVNLSDKSGSDKGYQSVPPPLSGNFIPRKSDLTFIDEIVESENMDVTTVISTSNVKTVVDKGVFNTVESNTIRRECCAPINEKLVSDGKKKTVFPTVSKIEFVGPKQPEKPVRKPVKYAKMYRSRAAVNAAKPKAVHNAVMRNRFHDVKASACWVWKPKNKVIDHGRKITEIDQDPGISLVQHGAEISTANPEVKTTGDSIEDIAAKTLVYIRRSAAKAKDKGKAKMEESESAMTKTKRQQEQERLGFEVAVRLQAELDKEERQRISRAEGLIQELL
ncbi:hypothetical protein Tco_0466223 [Tanacetum coccineum]